MSQVDGSLKWAGVPDREYAKPHLRFRDGRWVIEVGYLGHVPIMFDCGPDGRGSWRDLRDWPGWRKVSD